MNAPDPKWLAILKASGWQTSALTVACGLSYVAIKGGLIPTDGSPYWLAVPAIGTILFACLSIAAIASAVVRTIEPGKKIGRKLLLRKQQAEVRAYIRYMTEKDREIISYLLHHNQKMFQADQDGGYAAPLIARGIIRIAAQHRQVLDLTRVPFAVPDHIWEVLEENRKEFPFKPPRGNEDSVHPWAMHWMVR
jgi:rRNA-processing protein FCF1